jgi:hypothetical protein
MASELLADPDHLVSLAGALLVLGAYIGNLFHWLDSDRATYAALNAVGSGLLGYVALKSSPLGLILIEVAWTLISLVALGRSLLRRRS